MFAGAPSAWRWDRLVVVNAAGDGFFKRVPRLNECFGLIGSRRETLGEVPEGDNEFSRGVRLESGWIAKLHNDPYSYPT